jgi:hypothetical protein
MRIVLLFVFLFASCSTKTKKAVHKCEESPSITQDRHIIISAKLKMASLGNCFKNYLRFEENKKQSFNICHNFNVAKSGKVTYSKAYGIGKSIPKDFRMCIEQELWLMNFKKLQLEKPSYINFSFKYKSI